MTSIFLFVCAFLTLNVFCSVEGLRTTLDLPSSLYDDDPLTYCAGSPPSAQPFPLSGYEPFHFTLITRHGDRSPVHVWHWGEPEISWDCGTLEIVQDASSNTGQYAFLPQLPGATGPCGTRIWSGTCGIGQLTPRGHAQHSKIGTAVRQMLIDKYHLLPDVLTDNTTLYVRSTDVWRTRQSAASQLDALYPASKRSKGLVISVDVRPDAIETSSLSDACPKAKTLSSEQQKDATWTKYIESRKTLLEKLNRISGSSWNRLYEFSDGIHGRTCYGKPLPCRNGECVTEQDVRDVHAGANFEFTYIFNSDEIVRLGFSYFLHEVRQLWDTAIRTGKPKFALYSAHDFTITLLQRSFRLNPTTWPPYASNWMFELWKHPTDGIAIRSVLNGVVQTVPGCSLADGTVCSLADFDNILNKNFTIKDYEKECFS